MTSRTFMVVDDDAQFRALVAGLLVERGHRVIEAGSGRAATQTLTTERPDMILVDGLLPDGDGMTWIGARRKAGDKTPIAFVSAFWKDLRTFQTLTRDLGVALVLQKPITVGTFAQQVEAAVHGGGATKAVSDATTLRPAADGVTLRPVPVAADGVTLRPVPVAADDATTLRPTPRLAGRPPPPPPAAMRPRVVEPSPVPSPSAIESLFAAATADYRLALPDRIAGLRRLFGAVVDGEHGALPSARAEAHKLAGTAGSYGFGAVGEAARVLERLAARCIEGGRVGTYEWAKALGNLGTDDQPSSQGDAMLATPRRGGYRVLVVDDDPQFLDLCAAMGKARALEVLTARTTADALDLAHSVKLDAAIVDLRLAEGAEVSLGLACSLRALPGQESLPIAFVSAHGGLENRIAATQAGASLYLSKPIDGEMLSTAVHQMTAAARSARPRALVVDDDPAFIAVATATLADAGIDVTGLADAGSILEKLEEVRPDVLLLDVNMPGFSGFDVCRSIRATPAWQDLIILFVTTDPSSTSRIDGFQAGGDDFLSKPVVRAELLARVKVRVERNRLMRERLEQDALTGLPLRRTFLERLSARLAEGRRHQRGLSLALLDVDHFKHVNDRHGHQAGDRVLATLGGLLARRFRAEDLRARWGGEEFALAFFEEDSATVGRMLERTLEELQAIEFRSDHGEAFHVSFSAGVAAWPEEADGIQALVGRADRRLYEAKAAGRMRVKWGGQ
jgi:diguanylate cyclase (GGDEF)-like protein